MGKKKSPKPTVPIVYAVVFRAAVGHIGTGMTQRLFQEIAAELLSQHAAGIIHGVLGFPLQIKLTAREDQRIFMSKQKIRNFLPVLQNNIPPPGLCDNLPPSIMKSTAE